MQRFAGWSRKISIGLCLFFFMQSGKAPAPDIAAGYDQNLLVEVQQALNRDCPEAFAPAALITRGIEQAVDDAGRLPPSKAE